MLLGLIAVWLDSRIIEHSGVMLIDLHLGNRNDARKEWQVPEAWP
jgi:hypothetical protein